MKSAEANLPPSLSLTGRSAISSGSSNSDNNSQHQQRPFSHYGQHRQKHSMRFIFRSVSFALLVGGYALSNYWNGGKIMSDTDIIDYEGGGVRRRLSDVAVDYHGEWSLRL